MHYYYTRKSINVCTYIIAQLSLYWVFSIVQDKNSLTELWTLAVHMPT